MKFLLSLFLLITYALFSVNNSIAWQKTLMYTDPLPGAKYINTETSIIIKPFVNFNKSLLQDKNLISVEGSLSGVHTGKNILSTDKSTIIFKPDMPFRLTEKVSVKISPGLTSDNLPFEFDFYIKNKEVSNFTFNSIYAEFENFPSSRDAVNKSPLKTDNSNPTGFPTVTITNSSAPSPGYIFLSDIVNFETYNPYLIILNNSGVPVFSRQMENNCFDFKPQSNGNFTYFQNVKNKFYELNQSFNIIDSFACGNGYDTDPHELRLMSDGSYFIIGNDPQIIDMSQIVPGGSPNATVIGNIVQQIDANRNVIFQWRSWDHFQITDAEHVNLTADYIDYDHMNAIDIDIDGNILLSSRNLDEITKFKISNGDILWRMGGKNNQFTFINDTVGFSYQHAIRRIPNGNVTIYDNGNFHSPQRSRALEYTLNEQLKTATLVWFFRNIPFYYASAMGYCQRLSNGNTLIGWGQTTPTVTEVNPSGTKVFEMTFPANVYTYRAFRYDMIINSLNEISVPEKFELKQNYPNPFNPSTTISYQIGTKSYITIKVFDALGREIETLVNEKKSPGTYEAIFNASQFSSGIYFYKLTADGFSETKKMLMIK